MKAKRHRIPALGRFFAACARSLPWLFFLVACGVGATVHGQDIDVESLIHERRITCEDIALGATRQIPEAHLAGSTDTLQAILGYWEYHCGITEPMMRFTILWQIETNTFSQEWLPDRLIEHLEDHREAIKSVEAANYFFDFDAWQYHAMHPDYNDYTAQMAQQLKEYNDLGPEERFFVRFYSHDFEGAWQMLANDSLEGTRIDSLYRQHTEVELHRQRLHLGFYFGMWRPEGNLDVLGLSPQIGLMVEGNRQALLYGLHMKMAFGAPRQSYEVVVDGQTYQTRNMMQFYIGLVAGIDLLNSEANSLFLAPGLGYDGIDPFSQADRDAGISKTLHSLNANASIIYHRRLDTRNIITVLLRYNLVNYRNRGGTDLSGNVITFGVGYGLGQW